MVCLLALAGCAPSEEQMAKELETEVIALHDSVMANMGDLYNSRKELAALKDSLLADDTLLQQKFDAGIAQLAEADEQMMQWMRNYKAPDLKQPAEAVPYLQQEKEKMEKVQQNIEQSLQHAQDLKAQLK